MAAANSDYKACLFSSGLAELVNDHYHIYIIMKNQLVVDNFPDYASSICAGIGVDKNSDFSSE